MEIREWSEKRETLDLGIALTQAVRSNGSTAAKRLRREASLKAKEWGREWQAAAAVMRMMTTMMMLMLMIVMVTLTTFSRERVLPLRLSLRFVRKRLILQIIDLGEINNGELVAAIGSGALGGVVQLKLFLSVDCDRIVLFIEIPERKALNRDVVERGDSGRQHFPNRTSGEPKTAAGTVKADELESAGSGHCHED